jgi:2-amino-4-hydroxy-6-hydroxymethyldihydropteridine diphosphokinase
MNLQEAQRLLAEHDWINTASRVYETPPWGYHDQPAFLNQVLCIETATVPIDLLGKIKEIESKMGREPSFRNGPRLIDIDIILYGDQQIDLPGLIIPHPRMLERGFVMVPLAEIAPDLVIPGDGRTSREIVSLMDVSGIKVDGGIDAG